MKESAIQIQGKKRNHRFFLNSSRGASVHLLSKSVFITLVKDFVCRVGGGLLGCCDWLAASRVLFSSLWWWCIMPHPLLVIGLLTTFLLFFLPDLWWPWPVTRFIISTIYFTVWLTQPSWLAAAAGSVQHHWIMLHSWCTLIFFWSYFTFFFFFEIHTIFLHCGITMLGMIWVRACSALVGFRAPTCVRSLHSFPGITVAQVGCCPCVYLTRCIHNFSRYSC